MEKEVQQSKYEVIVLNHQLMEAIHQKNKVSSLLDQWQVCNTETNTRYTPCNSSP